MIDSARFVNFKGLRDVTVPLGRRFCVLVGPNGAGKTSVLEGLHLLGRYVPASNRVVLTVPQNEWRRLAFNGSKDGFEIHVTGANREVTVRSQAVIDKSTGASVSVDAQQAVFLDGLADFAGDSSLYETFGQCALLKLDADELGCPSIAGITSLDFNGRGLASVLATLKLRDDDRFDRIKTHLREIVPTIESFHIEQRTVSESNGNTEQPGFALLFRTASADNIPADLTSEGTLLVLGLLTIILGSPEPEPKIILLDDIDRALHPKAQVQLVKLIQRLLEEIPDLQIIATSHSPYLIDALELDEVILITSDAERGTVCRRLSDHPDAEKWKDATETGEFWTMVGEDWLTSNAGVTP